jgi:N-acetylmuramoyl-L-alanine amidase
MAMAKPWMRVAAAALGLALVTSACHGTALSGRLRTPILDDTAATKSEAKRWAQASGAPRFYRRLVPTYWRAAKARGVRPDLAYAQSAKETGFGGFSNVVTPSFKNPCGIKTTEGGANSDPDAHKRFSTWKQGIRACLDHLALYAGAPGYPRANSPDPRHFPSILGTAKTAQRLGGRWAPARGYGRSIVDRYLIHMILDF